MKDQRSKVEVSRSVNRRPAFLAGLLLGSVAGVAVLLVAPSAWEKTRSKIQKQDAKLRFQAASSMNDIVIEASDKAHEFTNNVDKLV